MDVSKRKEDAARGLPALWWMTAAEISAGGLSSSVAKVFKLIISASSHNNKSIKQFFKAK